MQLRSILDNESVSCVVPFDLNKSNVIVFDLTIENKDLDEINLGDTAAFARYIFTEMEKGNTPIAVGKYNEDRIMYRWSSLFEGENPRTIHLGIDLWAKPGTPVFTPLNARVHSFQNNARAGDYGPTIILEHNIQGICFFTLYGHLSQNSLHDLFEGKVFQKGEKIGEIGTYPDNGSWPPHLHFQIIMDMQGKKGDFPGVASLDKREYYLNLCPDPNIILRIERLN